MTRLRPTKAIDSPPSKAVCTTSRGCGGAAPDASASALMASKASEYAPEYGSFSPRPNHSVNVAGSPLPPVPGGPPGGAGGGPGGPPASRGAGGSGGGAPSPPLPPPSPQPPPPAPWFPATAVTMVLRCQGRLDLIAATKGFELPLARLPSGQRCLRGQR